ncbi:MAG: outer membrane beta-barrel protein [Proteobacteria bacterium]|nr:outer membrane beta-barrel protein [Pseudomonadota bacterium]
MGRDGGTRLARRAAWVALCGTLAAASGARADIGLGDVPLPRSNWTLFTGATRTDNATLSQGGPSDTIATAGGSLDFFRDTDRLHADINGVLSTDKYLDNSFPTYVRGRLIANTAYQFIEERLSWTATDTYGQVNADPLAPAVPTNLVNANVFATGPDARIPLAAATDLALGARYSQTDFGRNATVEVNDRRYSGNVGVIHRLSAATAVSINASASRTDYRTEGSPSYDETEAFLRLQFRRARTDFTLDAGAAELKERDSTVHDPLLRATLLRQMTPSSSVYLEVGSEFQDAGLAFQSALTGKELNGGQLYYGNGPGGVNNGAIGTLPADVILTQNALRADYARISLDYTRQRTGFDVTAGERRERYQFGGADFDRNIFLATALITRQFRPTLDGHILVTYMRRSPEGAQPADRTKQGEAALEWKPGSMLTVTLAYQRDDRSADVGGFAYVDNRVFLGLTFRGGAQPQAPGGPGAAPVGPGGQAQ